MPRDIDHRSPANYAWDEAMWKAESLRVSFGCLVFGFWWWDLGLELYLPESKFVDVAHVPTTF